MPSQRGVARGWLLLVIGLTFLAILVPFLFWHDVWFGTPLSNSEIQQYLTHLNHPRQTQHALSLVADRIIRGDRTVTRFYPDIVQLAKCQIPQIRETAAWVMGQDNTVPAFHQALLGLLHDPQPLVRMNAALALVRFRDASGHAEILRMLSGEPLLAPESGVLRRILDVGQSVGPHSLVAQIIVGKRKFDVLAGTPGTLSRWAAAAGARVETGQPLAVIAPSSQMAWEALRALYLIGRPDDLPVIGPYARGVAGMPAQVAEQARLTMREIRSRSGS
jgi:biotin carboxyl carrier protein